MLTTHLRRLAPLFAFLGLFFFSSAAVAQTLEQEFQLRLGVDVEKELVKDLDLVMTPEMRTVGMNPDKYLLEVGLKYKVLDFLSLRTGFRGDLEEKKDGLDGGYRARFDVVGGYDIGNFEPGARLRYSYEFGPYRDAQHSLRYLLGVDYNFKEADVKVGVAAEAFQDLGLGSFYKMRYGAGAEWEFYKTKKLDQSVGLDYYFDYYLDRYKNVHVVEIKYGIAF